jgi:hypothetical protein
MHKKIAVLVGCLMLGVPALARDNDRILRFDTMFGVTGAFRGPTNAIRGVPGAGAPWRLDAVKGEVRSDGRVKIEVEGLVLVSTGQNPAATFRGVVSCLTENNGVVDTVNVQTAEFPATADGDAEIDEDVVLPSSCVAPIVFITNAAGRWFAVTGQ